MTTQRVYRSALGITVGDIVQVRYNHAGGNPNSVSRPYEVWSIRGPLYYEQCGHSLVIRSWPVIYLTCVRPGVQHPTPGMSGSNGFSYVGGIRQEGERWFDDQNAEIIILQRGTVTLSLGLFAEPPEAPYRFQPGVDYTRDCWHCRTCGIDFNAESPGRWMPAGHCNWPALRVVLMPPRARPPEPDWSAYQVAEGYGEADKWWKRVGT